MATRRALHFVFKVGNRFQMVHFFRDVLGMQVQSGASGAGASRTGEGERAAREATSAAWPMAPGRHCGFFNFCEPPFWGWEVFQGH